MQDPITKSDAVRNLQRYLRRLSYEYPSILPVPVDGIFESRTQAALAEYQRLAALPITGRADKATFDALFAEYSRLTRERDLRRYPDFFPRIPTDYETVPEEHSSFVTLLQWMLGELRIIYDTIPDVPLTGIYDDATVSAVLEFQRIHALPQTGRVNRTVWNRMAEEYNQYARYDR